jgi:hypothetical protein
MVKVHSFEEQHTQIKIKPRFRDDATLRDHADFQIVAEDLQSGSSGQGSANPRGRRQIAQTSGDATGGGRGGKLELEPKWLEPFCTFPLQMASANATSSKYA